MNRSGQASPLDALVVINELAATRYSDPVSGQLVSEVPDGLDDLPSYDVNRDGRATPIDALYVINTLVGFGFQPNFSLTTSDSLYGVRGNVSAVGWFAQLNEGDSLRTEITAAVTVPGNDQGIRVMFETPDFDDAMEGGLQDAFEIAVTDSEGRTITQPFSPEKNAALNWSEYSGASYGTGSSMDDGGPSLPEIHDFTVNLAHLDPGEIVNVTARLINNDGDAGSSVLIRGLEWVSGQSQPPTEYKFASRASADNTQSIDHLALEDISSSITPSYGRTSYTPDRSQIISDIVLKNDGNITVTGDMIVVIDRLSQLETSVMHPDGLLSDGRPYFRWNRFIDGELASGESTQPREIRFANPGVCW